MTAHASSQSVLKILEDVSGKSVIVKVDPEIGGHATIRLPTGDGPAHLLRYKPEHENAREYLVAFQCRLALRTVQTDPGNRFDVSEGSSTQDEATKMVREGTRDGEIRNSTCR